jgi:hypothetical protein
LPPAPLILPGLAHVPHCRCFAWSTEPWLIRKFGGLPHEGRLPTSFTCLNSFVYRPMPFYRDLRARLAEPRSHRDSTALNGTKCAESIVLLL